MRKYILPFAVILFVILSDQLLKLWVQRHMMPGEEIAMAGNWFYLHYTENNGMAFGMELSGAYGKLILTSFRILVVLGIIWYLLSIVKQQAHRWFVVSVALVVAGALGNIIDSVFYGVVFEYAPLLHGRVIDMLYFPLVEGHFPQWFPIWGGEEFIFFRPVFNLADASISTGVISIFVFQKKFFPKKEQTPAHAESAEALNEEHSGTAENTPGP
jgi:signal peptidase II